MNPIPTNPTMSDLVTILREHHTILTTILQKENAMPCGVSTTTTQCASPMAPFFECCGRLKVQAFKCEAPTGCAGATFPVGLQLNVNEWASMGEYPVYAAKFFDCVGGKAYVGVLGAINGVVKYGLDVRVPNTANATAIRLSIVDPTTGAIIEGQEINIGLAPATDSDSVSGSGTTSPGLVLDSGVTVTGPFEAMIGTPNRNSFTSFWEPDISAEDPGILVTTEQRSWLVAGTNTRLETGFTVIKTKETDGFTMSVIDKPSGTMALFSGSVPGTDIAAGVFAQTAASGVAAGLYGALSDTNMTIVPGSQGLLGYRDEADKVWAGAFLGDIFVSGDATLAGTAYGGWADYVLEPDYDLMSLDDVAKYISETKTLPEMPSAEEVASGHGVGAMLKTIVAQLEKQMLYILQLDARLDAEGI